MTDSDLTSLHWLQRQDLIRGLPVKPLVESLPPSTAANSRARTPRAQQPKKRAPRRPLPWTPVASVHETVLHFSDLLPKDAKIYRTFPNRPPYPYVLLIIMVMKDSKKTMSLQEIYKAIQDNFCFFETSDPTWQSSIRHNLLLNDCFVKIPAELTKPGRKLPKASHWSLDHQRAYQILLGLQRNSPRKYASWLGIKERLPSTKSKRKRPAMMLQNGPLEMNKQTQCEFPLLNPNNLTLSTDSMESPGGTHITLYLSAVVEEHHIFISPPSSMEPRSHSCETSHLAEEISEFLTDGSKEMPFENTPNNPSVDLSVADLGDDWWNMDSRTALDYFSQDLDHMDISPPTFAATIPEDAATTCLDTSYEGCTFLERDPLAINGMSNNCFEPQRNLAGQAYLVDFA